MKSFLIKINNNYLFCLVSYIRKGPCRIDANNKSITVHNLRNNCNSKELRQIFSKLTAGSQFPPSGKFKGYVLPCPRNLCGWIEAVWNGKNIKFTGGSIPNDHGTVTNTIFGIFNWFKASIYRTNAPIDGKEAFAIDYKHDIFTFFIIDYIRRVQKNVYLGIATVRRFERNIVLFFLLEAI